MKLGRNSLNVALTSGLVIVLSWGNVARADFRCENLFQQTHLESAIPEDMQSAFAALSPKLKWKLEKRYTQRERIDAEAEARRLVSDLLRETQPAKLPLLKLIRPKTRMNAVQGVLSARLAEADRETRLIQALLDIGYKPAGPRAELWRSFRTKHARELAIAAKAAKNTASTMLLGAPLFLESKAFQNFEVPRSQRGEWRAFYLESQTKIADGDSKLMRDVKIEFAAEFISRFAAYAVLALITDDLLSSFFPEWRYAKVRVFGPIAMESRFKMEHVAFTNWQSVVEAFTGEKPAADSPEAVDILNRIRASTNNSLWLHIHEQGALSDINSPPTSESQSTSSTASEAVQMFAAPNLAP